MTRGIHQSFRGLSETLYDLPRGANTFQIFIRNNRNLKMRNFSKYDIDVFNYEILNTEVLRYVIHASYSMNPASVDERILENSKRIIREDMDLLSKLARRKYYVLHPGASKDIPDWAAINILAHTLHELKDSFRGVTVCVENMAGQGTQLLWTLDQMQQLYDECKDIPEFAFCIDMCHMFAAGMNSDKVIEWLRTIPIKCLGVVHLNGSKTAFASRVDRHDNLDEGCLPRHVNAQMLYALQRINENVPIILETPVENMMRDFEWLKNWK